MTNESSCMKLTGSIARQKLVYFGHIMRRMDEMEKELMLDKIEGKS